MRRRAQLILITAVFAAACGGGQKRVGGVPASATAAGKRFPALVRVPARATYAGAVVRLELLARLVRDLAGLVPTYSGPFGSSPGFAQAMDQEFRRMLGMSPIDPADLAQHGFAVDGSAAVFSTSVLPTFLLPVADRGRVEKLLEAATKQTTVIVAERRGTHYTTWTSPGGDVLVAYALLDDTLILHLGIAKLEKGQTAWLDEVLDAGSGIATEADVGWAFEQGGARQDALGLVRAGALGDAIRALEGKLAPRSGKGCEELDKRAAGVIRRVALAAALGDGKVDGTALVEVSADAAATLGAHLAAPPDGRYLAARADAGFHASTGLDLEWTSRLARELGKNGCGSVWDLLADLELWRLSDPFAATYGKRIFDSYHLAVLGTRVAGPSLEMQAIVWFGVADAPSLDQLLDLWVASPLTSKRKVGTEDVTRMNLALFGLAEPVDLARQRAVLRVAMGKGLIERLLTGPAGPAPARELVSLRFQADKFTDLQAPLAWVAQKVGASERDVAELARLLGRFRWFGLSAVLEAPGIRVTGGFELR